jgi:hypothetical protein
MTLGIFWLGQRTQLSRLTGMNRNLAWLHFLFLAVITALDATARRLLRLPARVSHLLPEHLAHRRNPLSHVDVR